MNNDQPETPKTVTVFFGTRQQADHWIRQNGADRRAVILATSPDRLRGLSCEIKQVHAGHWRPTRAQALRIEQTRENIHMIEVTRRG